MTSFTGEISRSQETDSNLSDNVITEYDDYFRKIAFYYDSIAMRKDRHVPDAIRFSELIPDADSVLEMGVGTGLFASELSQRGFRVTGIDVSPAMLSQGASRMQGNVECKCCAFEDYETPDSFDAVVSFGGPLIVIREPSSTYVASYIREASLSLLLQKVHSKLDQRGVFVVNIQKEPKLGLSFEFGENLEYALIKREGDARTALRSHVILNRGNLICKESYSVHRYDRAFFEATALESGFQTIEEHAQLLILRKA